MDIEEAKEKVMLLKREFKKRGIEFEYEIKEEGSNTAIRSRKLFLKLRKIRRLE